MASPAKVAAEAGREDISRFITHLTRDDRNTFNNGNSARTNFIKILKSRKIAAFRPHCIYNNRIKEIAKSQRSRLNVACFTEVPLNQLHLLTRSIEGRAIQLEPYGFVFTKEFIAAEGGQPAIYINSYEDNPWLREAIDELFEEALEDGTFTGKLWRILPFVNAMHEKYDFSWEREWRVRRRLKFKLRDLVCLILPNDSEESLRERCAKAGVAVISPGWTYEQIVAGLANQQRETKRLALDANIKADVFKQKKNDET